MYHLKYKNILGFLLFQYCIGGALGYGGYIKSHSMSGNTITLQLSSNTYWGSRSTAQTNRTCNTNDHIDYINGSSSYRGCTIRISYRTVYIHFDPWVSNVEKGHIIRFDSETCNSCNYTVEKDLTGGITVETDPYGLIPYVNLDGPYFNITPKPFGHGGREYNVSYDLGLPPGPSVQLYSPDWVASTTKSVLHITVTLVQSNMKSTLDFEFYTKPRSITISLGEQCGPKLPIIFSGPIFYAPIDDIKGKLASGYYSCSSYFFSETTLYKLGPNCKMEPVAGNKLFLFPGKERPLERLNYLEFNHTFATQKINVSYVPISTAQIQPIDHRLIFATMVNGQKLEFNVVSKYPTACGLNPSFTIEITKPDTCSKVPTSTLSGTKFTITNICTPILFAKPYKVKIIPKLGPNTYEDTFVYFYTESHQSIDHQSPVIKQKTGAITILFSEPINHTNQTIEDWPCNDFFFPSHIVTKLGQSCRMHRINNSTREIELILGKETTFVKGDKILFSSSFCTNCEIQITKNVPTLSLTTSNTTLVWNPQNSHTIVTNLSPLDSGEAFGLSYQFYEPPTCTNWQNTSITKNNNTLTISNLCESSFPYQITIKRVTSRLFYRETILSFITKEIPESNTVVLKYQESGMFLAAFNKDINYPTPTTTPNEWKCNAWFLQSSYEILGTNCKVKTFPNHPAKSKEIEIYLGNDTQVGTGTIIYLIESICPNCSLTLQTEQPTLALQKFGLPLIQPHHTHQVAGNAKDYCNFFEASKLYDSETNAAVNKTCSGVNFTHTIIPPTGKNIPATQIIQTNDTYIQLNIADPESSTYFYKFILRMTLSNGFYRIIEFKFYTQPMQEIAPSGIQILGDKHFRLEFTQEFDTYPITNLSDVFTTNTVNAIGSGSIISSTGDDGYETVLEITLGSDTTLEVGDELVLKNLFCPGCTYTILETPIFNCTGLENKRWDIKSLHTFTCSIQKLNPSDTRKFIYTDESISNECPMIFDLIGTYNETATINANTLCINYPYKLKIEFVSNTFTKIIYFDLGTFSTQIETNYEYSATFGQDVVFPDETNTTWNCDIYWFKPSTIVKLGDGCTVTKISTSKIQIKPGFATSLRQFDMILFSASFCRNCNFVIMSPPPSFTLKHDALPYWNPAVDHIITADIVDNTNGGTARFTYTVSKPANCSKEITLPQLREVTIKSADLCTTKDSYIVTVRMDIGNLYREQQFQFITEKEQKGTSIYIYIYIYI